MNKLVELIKKARFVFICGNGGSSATAEHFASGLFSKGIKAICLNSNTSVMTMIANDFGYEYVFMKQLEVFANFEDLLITISCSGTSPNVVNTIDYANFIKMKVYEFETFNLTDKNFTKDYGKLEDKHLKFAHKVEKRI